MEGKNAQSKVASLEQATKELAGLLLQECQPALMHHRRPGSSSGRSSMDDGPVVHRATGPGYTHGLRSSKPTSSNFSYH